MTTLYGISNCDTIKKAKKWLESHNIEYHFYDYKKQAVQANFLQIMIAEHGLDTLVNKRGTTYRKLSQEVKDSLSEHNLSEHKAVALLQENPSMIKRPILSHGQDSYIGFKAEEYSEVFGV